MRFFQARQKHSTATAGLTVTLVAVVWCASCGSNNGGIPGDDGPGGLGDDDSGTQCLTFGCSTSSGGDDGGFGTTVGPDGGIITVKPQNGPVMDNSCPGPLSAAN